MNLTRSVRTWRRKMAGRGQILQLSVGRRLYHKTQACSSNNLLMLRRAERLSLRSDKCKFTGFLSKLALYKKLMGFCSDEGYTNICMLSEDARFFVPHWNVAATLLCRTGLPLPSPHQQQRCRRECNPFFKPANLTRPSPSGMPSTENEFCDNAPTSVKWLCHGTEDENVITCDVITV
jgi:hypothetical protein